MPDDFELEILDNEGLDLDEEEIDDEEADESDDETEDEDSDEEGEDTLDEFEEQARKEYAQRMQALGFKVDANGDVIGVQDAIPKAKSIDDAVDEYDDLFSNDTAKLKNEIKAEFAPIMIDNYVKNVVQSNNKLAKYEKEVRTILAQTDPASITPQVVENYFWWARGQNADKEIAEAMKTKTDKTVDKIVKGKAAASESSLAKTSAKAKDAPVTPLIKKMAKGWNMDAQEMANKLRDAQKENK